MNLFKLVFAIVAILVGVLGTQYGKAMTERSAFRDDLQGVVRGSAVHHDVLAMLALIHDRAEGVIHGIRVVPDRGDDGDFGHAGIMCGGHDDS